jgi:hypothetical protein
MKVPSTVAEFSETFPQDDLKWARVTGSPRFDYPIDYSVAVLHVDEEAGRIDFLSRWESDSYCHYHRHVGVTSLLVLEGEHHVVENKDHETVHKIRKPGFFATNPGGDVHMEYGGPEGTLVYFSCQAVDGALFDVMDRDGRVLKTATVEEFASGEL